MALTEAKRSLKQTAYEYIKEKILTCEYYPGSFLNEHQLCQELEGISRTPVRDALSRLEQDGLVTILPKKGVMVSEVRAADLNRIYEVRMMLEPYVLRRYGERIDSAEMQAIYGQLVLAINNTVEYEPKVHHEQDDHFHSVIMAALPNPMLMDAYRKSLDLSRRFRVFTGNQLKARIADTHVEHMKIVQACISQNWEEAAQAMQAHLEISRRLTFQLLMDNDALF